MARSLNFILRKDYLEEIAMDRRMRISSWLIIIVFMTLSSFSGAEGKSSDADPVYIDSSQKVLETDYLTFYRLRHNLKLAHPDKKAPSTSHIRADQNNQPD